MQLTKRQLILFQINKTYIAIVFLVVNLIIQIINNQRCLKFVKRITWVVLKYDQLVIGSYKLTCSKR
jgi:hypothetical protein